MNYKVSNGNIINHEILKALIIDDEADICYLLSTLLKQKNLETEYVNTLSEAALALKKDIPEIIFLDNHLPDGLGLNFIEYIKKHYPNTKIIMITAHDTAADRQKALVEGVDYFIPKPFTRDLIYQAVEQIMN
jgi:two-component system, OmpR family, response regulator